MNDRKQLAFKLYAMAFVYGVIAAWKDGVEPDVHVAVGNASLAPRDGRNHLWKRGVANGYSAMKTEMDAILLGDQDANTC